MKKLLALLLVVAMVCGAFVPAFAATDAEMAAEAKLAELGVLNDDRADDNLTRAEMIVLLSRLLGEEAAAEDFPVAPTFEDAQGHWGANYISWAESLQYVNGYEDETFRPDATVAAQEYQAVLLRALGYEVAWADVPAKAEELGLVATVADATAVKRGEASVMTVAALEAEMADGSQTLAAKLGMVADLAIVSAEQTDTDEFTVTFNQAVTEGTFSVMRGKIATAVKEVKFDGATAVLTMERTIREFDYKITYATLEATVAGELSKVTTIDFLSEDANLTSYTTEGMKEVKVAYAIYDQFGNEVESTTYLSLFASGTVPTGLDYGVVKVQQTNAFLMEQPIVVNAVYNDTKGNVVTATQTFLVKEPLKIVEVTLGEAVNMHEDAADQEIMKEKTGSKMFWAIPVTALDQYGNEVLSADFFAEANASVIGTPVAGHIELLSASDDVAKEYEGTLAFVFDTDSTDGLDMEPTKTANEIITVVYNASGANDIKMMEIPRAGVADFVVAGPVEDVIGGTTVAFDFEAYDAYGNAILDAETLSTSDITVSGVATDAILEASADDSFYWSENALTGVVTLKYKAAAGIGEYGEYKFATFNANNKVKTVDFKVLEDSKIIEFAGFNEDATETVFVYNNTATAGYTVVDFDYYDQYGEKVEGPDADTALPVTVKDADGTTVATVSLATAGSENYTAVLDLEGDNDPEFEFTVKVVEEADVDKVEVTQIGTLYAVPSGATTTADYTVDIEFKGFVDGTEVAVTNLIAPTATVTPLGENIDNTDLNVFADGVDLKEDTTYTRTVLVGYTFNGKPVTDVQEVTLDTTEPAAESIEFKVNSDEGHVASADYTLEDNALTVKYGVLNTASGSAVVYNAANAGDLYFKTKNQYGVADAEDVAYAYVVVDKLASRDDGLTSSYAVDPTTFVFTTANGKAGDEFTITAVTDSGLTQSIKVFVK